MSNPAILQPVFALAMLTGLVLLLIPIARIRAVQRRQIGLGDFKLGESAAVPERVCIPNRNYMNLLELPLLFYVVCLLIYATGSTTPTMLQVAWAYVALRVVHSAIHLSYNHVFHRFLAFALSNVVLVVLWTLAATSGMAHADENDEAQARAAVAAFHQALGAGDTDAALRRLAPDAVVMEGGDLETRTHYQAHHLEADIAFARAVKSQRSGVTATVHGEVAWVSSTSTTAGTYNGKAVHLNGAELIVLTKAPTGWLIRAIHWSSNERK